MNPITILLRAAQHSSVSAVFTRAGGYIQQFRSQINSSLLSTVSAAAMAQKAIGMVTSTMSQVTAEAKKFQQQGARLGIDPAEIAKLNKLSEETGTSTRNIFKGFNQLKGVAAEALRDPTSEAAQNMKQLGITTDQLSAGLENPSQLFGQVSDKLNEIGDEGQKMTALTAIFKNNGQMLAGVIDAGSEGQKELMDGNTTQTSLMIAQNAEMKDAWEKFWDSVSFGFAALGVVLNPIVQLLRMILNIFSMITKVLGGGAFALLEITLAGILAILGLSVTGWGRIATAMGGVLKHIPFMGDAGKALEKIGESTVEWGDNLVAGAGAMANESGKTLKATWNGIKEDASDIADSAGDMGVGYGDGKKGGKSESRTFEGAKSEADIKRTNDLKKKREEALADLKRENEIVDAVEQKKAEASAAQLSAEQELAKLKEDAIKKAEAGGKVLTDAERQAVITAVEASDAFIEADTKRIEAKKALLQIEKDIAKEAKKAKEEADKDAQKAADALNKEKTKSANTFKSIADRLRDEQMKKDGKSDKEIKKAQFASEMDKLQKQSAEYQAYMDSVGGRENAEKTVTGQRMLQESAGTMDNLLKLESEINADSASSKLVRGDAMARIGGGGSVVTSNGGIVELTKEQRDLLKAIRTGIDKLVEKNNAAGGSSFTFLREQGLTGATANAALASDNSPK